MTSLPDQNAGRIEREIRTGQDRVRSFPNDIFFSTEHRCNLRCLMCVSTADRKRGVVPLADRQLPALTLARFGKLEPQVPYWREVRLTGTGETLLSPDLPRILELLAPHPAVSSFATNGLLLDRQKAELLVRLGLNRVIISMDAACAETYERIRVGGKWETLLEGVKTLVQVKRDSGSRLPEIFYYGTFRRDNIEELQDMVAVKGWLLERQGTEEARLYIDGEPAGEQQARSDQQTIDNALSSKFISPKHGFRSRIRIFFSIRILSKDEQYRNSRSWSWPDEACRRERDFGGVDK